LYEFEWEGRVVNRDSVQILIQCRLSSSRLPAKALLPIGKYSMVELVYRRVAQEFPRTLVVTSTDPSDDLLVKHLNMRTIPCFRGDLNNVLKRFHDVCASIGDFHSNSLIVRLTADNVIPDASFLVLMLEYFNLNGCEYLTSSQPGSRLPYGLSAEVFRFGLLEQAFLYAESDSDREHVTPWIIRNARVVVFSPDQFSEDLSGLRCTVDTFDDYLQLNRLLEGYSDLVTLPALQFCRDMVDGKGIEK